MTLPPDDTLFDALVARDPAWDGRVWVGVTSTGIFCRLTCPARKPLRGNCRFFASPAACLDAGFRPCLRCHPVGTEPLVAGLLAALDSDPAQAWSEAALVAAGHDPSTVRRAFLRQTGTTFLALARARRLAAGVARLRNGAPVIEAQLDAGFDSAAGFRDAVARLLGVAPAVLRWPAPLRVDWIATPLGPMIAVADARALHLLEFADRRALAGSLRALPGPMGLGRHPPIDVAEAWLGAYFARRVAPCPALAPAPTAFATAVRAALLAIPPGATLSYAQIAATIGRPSATRAVARANGTNRLAVIVPCHRVIGSDGALRGYAGGLWRKRSMIDLEATPEHAI